MATTTSRLALAQPVTTDAPSELRVAITGNATALDGAVIATSGTLSARPTTSLVFDQEYYATDTGVFYKYTGSAWVPVMTGRTWTNVTLPTNFIAGNNYTPSCRVVGDKVEMSGQILNNTGASTSAGATYGTVPSACFPASPVQTVGASFNGGWTIVALAITTGGAINVQAALGSGASVSLDGLSYRLS